MGEETRVEEMRNIRIKARINSKHVIAKKNFVQFQYKWKFCPSWINVALGRKAKKQMQPGQLLSSLRQLCPI